MKDLGAMVPATLSLLLYLSVTLVQHPSVVAAQKIDFKIGCSVPPQNVFNVYFDRSGGLVLTITAVDDTTLYCEGVLNSPCIDISSKINAFLLENNIDSVPSKVGFHVRIQASGSGCGSSFASVSSEQPLTLHHHYMLFVSDSRHRCILIPPCEKPTVARPLSVCHLSFFIYDFFVPICCCSTKIVTDVVCILFSFTPVQYYGMLYLIGTDGSVKTSGSMSRVVDRAFSGALGQLPRVTTLRQGSQDYVDPPLWRHPYVLSMPVISTDGLVVSCSGWSQLLTWVINCGDTSGLPNNVKRYIDLNTNTCHDVTTCGANEEELAAPSWSTDRICGVESCPPVREQQCVEKHSSRPSRGTRL